MNTMKVVAFLPAKGTSGRIPNKNIQLLDGKPLFLHTLEKLIECEFIDEVYLDTDSENIIELASEVPCKIMRRDPDYASNKTDGHQLFMNEVGFVEADIYIQILGTSPFIEAETISKGLDILKSEANNFDSVVLVRRDKQYLWTGNIPSYNAQHIPNSIDLPDTIIETMGLYIVKREAALQTNRRIGNHPYLLEASPLEAIDVNWPEDFALASLVASGIREKDRKLLSNLKNHISSSMLSDVLDDMGYPCQIIKILKPSIMNAKFLGRSKTIKLRVLRDGEDFRGIYNALETYNSVIPNDVIVVENEASDFAYFGELNANLALRAGASAAVIGGKTRDTSEVTRIGFPVFSTGSSCQDVRTRATFESFNKAIQIDNVKISPGDLIFGDVEGVVVIPKRLEAKVIEEIFLRTSTEKNILVDISKGIDVGSIVKDHGTF